jgi:hypothetical protein
MTVNAGSLTYNAGMVFLTLTGDLLSDAGACGTLSQPGASFWVLCRDRQGDAPPSIDVGPSPITQLPAGQYSCVTQVETFASINGLNHHVAGGDSGTLTLTADGSKVTGQYSGDQSLAGNAALRRHDADDGHRRGRPEPDGALHGSTGNQSAVPNARAAPHRYRGAHPYGLDALPFLRRHHGRGFLVSRRARGREPDLPEVGMQRFQFGVSLRSRNRTWP